MTACAVVPDPQEIYNQGIRLIFNQHTQSVFDSVKTFWERERPTATQKEAE
jgi:hypothetical protein